jgi:hypothetical protein
MRALTATQPSPNVIIEVTIEMSTARPPPPAIDAEKQCSPRARYGKENISRTVAVLENPRECAMLAATMSSVRIRTTDATEAEK